MGNKKILIIGAGGVSNVATHKCAQMKDVFSDIFLASRTKAKCDKIASDIAKLGWTKVKTFQVDADNVPELVKLIKELKPDLVLNVALPYQDLTIMDACLECKVDYIDTANYEPLDTAKFEYKWQWAYQDKFKEAGIMAVMGAGFDPGVTNMYCAYAQKHLFDEINYVDILDCNAGDHGLPFATNFNPEINIREITSKGRYWQEGKWIETDPISIRCDFDYPEVGVKPSYLLYHEELESLCKNLKGLKRIRFWMTFGDKYLTHLRVLQNVGMTSIKPIKIKGVEIAPIEFLKAVLPDPASLGPLTKGKTNIGCIIEGVKDGKRRKVYIYNVCVHEECYAEVKSQAISYTTGVPAASAAAMVATKTWDGDGVFNMEQLDPDPFLKRVAEYGLPWKVLELDPDKSYNLPE